MVYWEMAIDTERIGEFRIYLEVGSATWTGGLETRSQWRKKIKIDSCYCFKEMAGWQGYLHIYIIYI